VCVARDREKMYVYIKFVDSGTDCVFILFFFRMFELDPNCKKTSWDEIKGEGKQTKKMKKVGGLSWLCVTRVESKVRHTLRRPKKWIEQKILFFKKKWAL
jgi:hypothetical protein